MMKSIYRRTAVALMLVLVTAATALGKNIVYCNAQYLMPGETGEIVISLDNDDDCFGFQADIQIPEGWEFVTENGKVAASLTDRADNSYTLVSKLTDSHSVCIGMFSTQHTQISGNSGALLKLKAQALHGFSSDYVMVTNAIIVNKDDRDVTLEDTYAYIVYIPARSIELYLTEEVMKVGTSVTVMAMVQPFNATDKTVTWTSSNPDVATVDAVPALSGDSYGKVRAKAPGSATITATCGEASAGYEVTVVKSTTGIEGVDVEAPLGDIYTLQGVCVKRNATAADAKALAPGIYVVGGQMVRIK